jgi:transposase
VFRLPFEDPTMPTILPDPVHLRLDHIRVDTDVITLVVASKDERAPCPLCGEFAERVHSRYVRTLADLPWNGVAVRLQLAVRRFVCAADDCRRRIFAERFPALTTPYARRTTRLTDVVELIGFALGGEAGARVLTALTMEASPDTLLRVIRHAALPAHETPRVLGVDDFAFRRGRSYGTVLVDLERHCQIDVLPDRTAEALRQWLSEHPGVEIISRDRGGAYAEGARLGAPDAVQVADRFHVVGNLRQAVERLLQRHHHCLRDIPAASSDPVPEPSTEAKGEPDHAEPGQSPTRAQRESEERRSRRHARYEEVMRLHHAGMSSRTIAREVGLSRHTVQRFIRAAEFPERAPRRPRPGILTPYEAYLRERWNAGCQNAQQLWREIREQGFPGSYSQVRHVLAAWRSVPGRPGKKNPAVPPPPPAPPSTESVSPRQASWLLFRAPEELDEDEQRYLTHIRDRCPDAATIRPLIQDFRRLVRERDRATLDDWLCEAEGAGIKELMAFAAGLRRDRAAIDTMLEVAWSNGQLEGQVNRLKLLKRQMYGRASFDLLRQRVLRAS